MDKVSIEDVDSWMGPAKEKKSLTNALGTEDVSVNYYELDPGDSFAFGYHKHEDQEEIFILLDGEVVFETEDGVVEVVGGEAVRFPPGEYQRGVNKGDGRVVAIAIGAPREMGETEILRECNECNARTPQSVDKGEDGDVLVTVCENCGSVTGRFT